MISHQWLPAIVQLLQSLPLLTQETLLYISDTSRKADVPEKIVLKNSDLRNLKTFMLVAISFLVHI
jgi:hypothetical protein